MPPKSVPKGANPLPCPRRKPITKTIKETLLTKQYNKCANLYNTGFTAGYMTGCEGYVCPLWRIPNNQGQLDIIKLPGGINDFIYEVDHIDDLGCGGQDIDTNLQILCPSCHSYKTKMTIRISKKDLQAGISVPRRNEGASQMDTGMGGGMKKKSWLSKC